MPLEDTGWIYQQVFESNIATVVLDPQSLLVLAANHPLVELSGLRPDELVGKPITFLQRRDSDNPADFLRNQPATVFRKDGDRIPVEVFVVYVQREPQSAMVLRLIPTFPVAPSEASPLLSRHEALQRSHRQLQEAYNRLELLNDTLGHRNRELKEVYRRLAYASKMAAIGELAAGTTHGINNPLAAAVSANREMEDCIKGLPPGSLSEKMQSLCSRSDRALKRIEGIISDLRRLAQSGTRRGEIQVVFLECELRIILDLIQHRLKEVSLGLEIPSELRIRVSPDEFSQVIMNLVDNAVAAMAGRGQLTIIAHKEHGDVVIELADTGPGIQAEILDHVFEPFFSTKAPKDGSGMGLAVAREIIEGYAGMLTVKSSVGQGATFTIRLPGVEPGEKAA
jgi:signal transduction histidine kinase